MAFVDLCRLCGTDTLNIVRNAIFEGEGRVKKYALKISECLTLKVDKEDKLPKIMCGECSYKLDLLSDFRDVAYKTATQLLSRIEVKTEPPDVTDIPNLDNGDVGGDTDIRSSSPEPLLEPAVQIKEEVPQAEERPAATEMQELSKEHSVPDVVTASVGGNDTVSSSLELPAEPEAQIKEEVIQTKKHQQISKLATKRSMKECESEKEQPAKKRGRKVKQPPTTISKAAATTPAAASTTPAAASTTPAAAPPKDSTGISGNSGVTLAAVFICEDCHEPLTSESEMRQHLLSCVNQDRKPTIPIIESSPKLLVSKSSQKQIQFPAATFGNRKAKHTSLNTYQQVAPLSKGDVSKKQDSPSTSIFTCSVKGCSFSSNLQVRVQLHKLRVHVPCDITECPLCGEKFTENWDVRVHVKCHETLSYVVLCFYPGCNKTFSESSFRKHFDTHKSTPDQEVQVPLPHWICPECNIRMECRAKLRKHSRIHGMSRTFAKPDGVVAPSRSTTTEFKCPCCGLQYSMLKTLNQHLKRHETCTPGMVQCLREDCLQLFSSVRELREHSRTHKGQKFKCEICGSLQVDICGLRRHIKRHNREQKTEAKLGIACHLCGHICSSKNYLNVHLKSHESGEDGVFKCVGYYCRNVTFSSSEELKKHVLDHKAKLETSWQSQTPDV